jgi:hypothetical protein
MERAGASVAIHESELSPEGLAEQVRALMQERTRRDAMAEAARQLGRLDAAAAIVDDLCAFLGVAAESGVGDADHARGELNEDEEHEASVGADEQEPPLPAHLLHSRTVRRPRVRTAPLRVRPIERGVNIGS